jgi:hypothetical protein
MRVPRDLQCNDESSREVLIYANANRLLQCNKHTEKQFALIPEPASTAATTPRS